MLVVYRSNSLREPRFFKGHSYDHLPLNKRIAKVKSRGLQSLAVDASEMVMVAKRGLELIAAIMGLYFISLASQRLSEVVKNGRVSHCLTQVALVFAENRE